MAHLDPNNRASTDTGVLDFLWMELTNRCNLTCAHCYAQSSPHSKDINPLSLTEQISVLVEGRDLGCKNVQFIGGEPTLNKNLHLLVSKARLLGYDVVEVFTNLTHLSNDLLQCFVENKANVATSVYSSSADTHDAVTGVRGSFKRTIANLRKLVAHGVGIRVSIIEMAQNTGEGEKTTFFLREDMGINDVKIDKVRSFGRASDKGESVGGLCGFCAQGTLCIGPDGVVTPCIMSKMLPVGSVRTGRLQEIALSERLGRVRIEIRDAVQASSVATENCNPVIGCTPLNQCGPVINRIAEPEVCNPVIGCTPLNQCGPVINKIADPHVCNPVIGCTPLNQCGPVINKITTTEERAEH